MLMLENIENYANLDHKLQTPSKPKGDERKCMMELSNYRIPKQARQGLVHWKLPEKQGKKHCVLCKKHGGPFKATICPTVVILTKMAPKSRIVEAQVSLSIVRRGLRVQSLCS